MVFLFLVGPIILVVVILQLAAKAMERRTELLRGIAARFPGMILEEGAWLQGPRLRWHGPGWRGIVSFFAGAKNSPPYSRLELKLEKPGPVLRLTPQGLFSGIAKFFGAQDIEIGVPEFDREYAIAAQPAEYARRFLTSDNRARVEGVRALAGGGSILVSTAGQIGEIRIGRYCREMSEVVEFLNRASDLAAALAGPATPEEVQIISASLEKRGACQVCGQDLGDKPVRCRKCKTPHHRECWEYLRVCSTFACGETKFE